MIAVVDAHSGNLRSVEKALRAALALVDSHETVTVTSDPDTIAGAERIVVPGQGAFSDAGRVLSRNAPVGRAVVRAVEDGKPYLGICLGLQVLFDESDEAPGVRGLGLLRGRVQRIPDGLPDGAGGRLKVPHMGWNEVAALGRPHPLLGSAAAAYLRNEHGPVPYYYVHSYHAVPEESLVVAATSSYGDLRLVAAVAVRNVFAVQFHPEKSQQAGLSLLGAFVRWRG